MTFRAITPFHIPEDYMNKLSERAFLRPTILTSLVWLTIAPLISLQVYATELDLNISNKSINLQLNTQPPLPQADTSKFDVGAGYIYREGGTKITNLDFHALGQTVLGNMPTSVLIGARVIYFDEDAADGAALALGGGAHIKVPRVPGVGIKVMAHFAPQITAFGDAKDLFRTDLRATYRVIQNADIYAGYRAVHAKIEHSGTQSIDENFHLGFTLIF
jgi:hypothetical protein